MLDFYYFGKVFVDFLGPIGDFLMYRPFDNIEGFEVIAEVTGLASQSLGSIFFGGGFLGFLCIKLFKFFWELIPGN